MAISKDEINILRTIHAYSQMKHPLTDELKTKAERLIQKGLVMRGKTGLYTVDNDVQWVLVQQGIIFPTKK